MIEVGGGSRLAPALVAGLVLLALLAARPAIFEAYLEAKEASQPQPLPPPSPSRCAVKVYVSVKLLNGTRLWGERALAWLAARGKEPVLKPTRGDRPSEYRPVASGVEGGEAFFCFDAPLGEWYWIWPTDCPLCVIRADGKPRGAVYIEGKGVWSYPPD